MTKTQLPYFETISEMFRSWTTNAKAWFATDNDRSYELWEDCFGKGTVDDTVFTGSLLEEFQSYIETRSDVVEFEGMLLYVDDYYRLFRDDILTLEDEAYAQKRAQTLDNIR